MTDIDWKGIADAIRESRFEDVTPEVWNQVADKIESSIPKKNEPTTTKKRERKRPPKPKPPKWNKDLSPKENGEKYWEYFNNSREYEKNKKNPTAFDRCFDYGLDRIIEQYEAFHKPPTTSQEAYEKVAKKLEEEIGNFGIGWKTIEGLVTAIRKEQKFQYEEAKAAQQM